MATIIIFDANHQKDMEINGDRKCGKGNGGLGQGGKIKSERIRREHDLKDGINERERK